MIKPYSFKMEEILPPLKEFIVDYCDRYKIRKVDPRSLNLDTSIDLDLDIVDIEIDLFLADFAEEFKVDPSKFSWYKYGYPRGSTRVKVIKMVFNYESQWVKQLAHYCYKPKFMVRNLQDAVKTGRLI